jgi:hypothetical protein
MRIVLTILFVMTMAALTRPAPVLASNPVVQREALTRQPSPRLVPRRPSPKLGRGWTGLPGRVRASEVNAVTSYPRMVAELHADAQRSHWVSLAVIGKSHDGRALWLVRVANPQGPSPARTTRLFVLFRQHGDEPAPTEAALALLRRIVTKKYRLPQGVTLYMIPMVNPDGADLGTRENGIGADLNRDWGIFSQPETRAVANAMHLIHPQILVDAHNWDATDSYNANCIEVSRDLHSYLAVATQAMQSESVAALKDRGYTVAPTTYGDDSDPHLAHRWFAHQGIMACLVETHSGSPKDTADYQSRQGIYMTLIETLAHRYAGDHAALDALEGTSPASVREASLFVSPQPSILGEPREATQRRLLIWPWAVLPYGLALFVLYISRGGGNGTARKAEFVPATGRRSAGRLGKRQYQY